MRVIIIVLPYNIMNGLSIFSVSAFLSIASLNNSNNFFSCSNSNQSNVFLIHYNQIGGHGCRISMDGVRYDFDSSKFMNDNLWHHIVIIKNDKLGILFIDGQKIGKDIPLPQYSLNIEPNGVLIGQDQDQDCVGGCCEKTQGWKGNIDYIRIYNRVLSESEIQQLYNEAISPSEDNYDEGYEAGKQYCINNPEACGWLGGYTQSNLNNARQAGYNSDCDDCSNGSSTPATISPELNLHIPTFNIKVPLVQWIYGQTLNLRVKATGICFGNYPTLGKNNGSSIILKGGEYEFNSYYNHV